MLDSFVIVGLVIIIVEIIKKSLPFFETEVGKLYIVLFVFVLAGAFNIVNGCIFGVDGVTQSAIVGYLRDGLVLGAIASGLYSAGKAVLVKE